MRLVAAEAGIGASTSKSHTWRKTRKVFMAGELPFV
jgi:hypothetical protein